MKRRQAAKISTFFIQTPKRVRASDEGEKGEGVVAKSTADYERAFSTMKRVKTPLRNRQTHWTTFLESALRDQ